MPSGLRAKIPTGWNGASEKRGATFSPCNPRREAPFGENDLRKQSTPTEEEAQTADDSTRSDEENSLSTDLSTEETPSPAASNDHSNDFFEWRTTSNDRVAYFLKKKDNSFQCGYIGNSNKSRLKAWKSTLCKFYPRMGVELRAAESMPEKWELKVLNITQSEFESNAAFNFFKDPSEEGNTKLLKTYRYPSPYEIKEEELPKGCYISVGDTRREFKVYCWTYEFDLSAQTKSTSIQANWQGIAAREKHLFNSPRGFGGQKLSDNL